MFRIEKYIPNIIKIIYISFYVFYTTGLKMTLLDRTRCHSEDISYISCVDRLLFLLLLI